MAESRAIDTSTAPGVAPEPSSIVMIWNLDALFLTSMALAMALAIVCAVGLPLSSVSRRLTLKDQGLATSREPR